MTDVTISVVVHNQRVDLERLMPSLVKAAANADSEVMIVDNRSRDGTCHFLESIDYPVSILHNPARAGYAENHNLNLPRARGKYFVIMNADVFLPKDVFSELCAFMDANPDVGIVAPKVLNVDGTLQPLNKRLPTLLVLFLRRFGPDALKRRFQHQLDAYEMRDVGYDHICDVPFLSGAFLFCRTDLLRAIGGFDERYFMYFEDVDLCRRVARTHRTVYNPVVAITHVWKRAVYTSWRFTIYFMQSAAKYFWRWRVRIY